MRSLGLSLLLCTVPAALACAQQTSSNNPPKQDATVASSQHSRTAQQARYEDSDDGVCYTMRTYYFERQDGNAPVQTGMTTCTRISQRDLKHVDSAPKARLLPAIR